MVVPRGGGASLSQDGRAPCDRSYGPPGRGSAGTRAGSSLYVRMKRRSIQSFQRHTQRPSAAQLPREAMAYWSPVLIKASHLHWGTKGRGVRPVSTRRRFWANGLPWCTAITPDFSRGYGTTAATSP